MYQVIGLSIKEALQLNIGDILENVFEDGPRPTALTGVIKSVSKLEDNSFHTQDYYCDIEVNGFVGKCRLTFANLFKSTPCHFCGWIDGEHSGGCIYNA